MTGQLPVIVPEIVQRFPHATDAFTQGLLYREGELYEGTGLYGRSWLRRVELATGEVLQQAALPGHHFGEGIAIVGEELFQLTWTSQVAFVYDRASFTLLRRYRYPGEGWGLAFDGESLVASNGSETLRFLEPATLAERRKVRVTAEGKPVRRLNALQAVEGELLANLWCSDDIARIDPASGKVTGWIDCRELKRSLDQRPSADAVLNGIAWDAAGRRLFVTGKLWSNLFEIRLPR